MQTDFSQFLVRTRNNVYTFDWTSFWKRFYILRKLLKFFEYILYLKCVYNYEKLFIFINNYNFVWINIYYKSFLWINETWERLYANVTIQKCFLPVLPPNAWKEENRVLDKQIRKNSINVSNSITVELIVIHFNGYHWKADQRLQNRQIKTAIC